MNTIDRSVELQLADGRKHQLRFTVKSVIECEKELPNHNLLLTVASLASMPLAIGEAYALLKWGLLGAGSCEAKDVDDLFLAYVDEIGLIGIQGNVLLALEKSGVIGKAKNKAALPKEQ